MNTEQILQVIDAVSRSSLSEFKFEGDGIKLSLKKTEHSAIPFSEKFSENESISQAAQASQRNMISKNEQTVNPTEASAAGEKIDINRKNSENTNGNIVKSPLVGTFYAAPAEDAASFVQVGDHVKEGQVLAIIEAMKLMNEIESDFTGTVEEILVKNGEAVEYGQPLFVIK